MIGLCLHIQGITRLAPSEPWSACTVTSERAASSQIAPGQVTTLKMRAPCSHLRSCVRTTPSCPLNGMLSSLGIVRMWRLRSWSDTSQKGTAAEPLPECAVDDLLSRAASDAAAHQEGEGSLGCSGSTESSESSSSSSSDDDMDEDLDQCHEDGRSLVHQVRDVRVVLFTSRSRLRLCISSLWDPPLIALSVAAPRQHPTSLSSLALRSSTGGASSASKASPCGTWAP